MIRLIKKLRFMPVFGSVIFMFVGVLCDLFLPRLTSLIIDNGVAKGNISYIWKLGVVMLLITLISVIASLTNSYFSSKESMRFGKIIRSEVFKKTIFLSGETYDFIGTSSLITRTTNDVEQIQGMLQSILHTMIMTPIMLIGSIFLAFSMNAQLTKTFLLIIPIIILVMGLIFGLSVPVFSKMQKATDKLNLVFREALTGVRVIRAFNKTEFERQRFALANRNYFSLGMKVNSVLALAMPIIIFIISIANAGIVWFGGHYISEGMMKVGDLIAFTSYAMMILSSFMMVAMLLVMIPRAFASTKRINEILDLKESIQNPTHSETFPIRQPKEVLSFSNVCYAYQTSNGNVLENISFKIDKGQTVAIVGATGSGKSTLLQLIFRLLDPTSGEIKMNDRNLKNLQQTELRSKIGFVPQKSRLFTGTIRENIQYGKLGASDEEIWEALRIAQAKDFVNEFPEGLSTKVEQDGGNFSGGQRQRLCIARAVIKQAEFYILDDSFSALDFKTDSRLRNALLTNFSKSTFIIVAQRISTIKNADVILLLEKGILVGVGTHNELKDTNNTYREILYSQLSKGEGI